MLLGCVVFFFSSIRRHTRSYGDWSSDVCSSDLTAELKTKPTQHSVRELMEIGIQPDILVCRTERPLSEDIKRKIALFCNVDFGCVGESPEVRPIYEVPLKLHSQGLDKVVCQRIHLETKAPDLRAWAGMVDRILNAGERIKIAVVGKYNELADSYKSIHEALVHGGIANACGVDVDWISPTGSRTRRRRASSSPPTMRYSS